MDTTVTRRTTVTAPAATVFALLSDPHEHAAPDGSGLIRGVEDSPARLVLGSVCAMRMVERRHLVQRLAGLTR